MQHNTTRCNTLHRTAPCCTTLQHAATHCNTLQHTHIGAWGNRACLSGLRLVKKWCLKHATRCNTLQHAATRCNTLHHTTPRCTTLHHTTPPYTTLHHTAPRCTTLHHAAPRCTTQHYTAPHCTTLHHTTTRNDAWKIKILCTRCQRHDALIYMTYSHGLFVWVMSRLTLGPWHDSRNKSWDMKCEVLAHSVSMTWLTHAWHIHMPRSYELCLLSHPVRDMTLLSQATAKICIIHCRCIQKWFFCKNPFFI